MTLTTVECGHMHPVTSSGQVAASVIAVFDIGLYALPASILAAGFLEDSPNEDDEQEAETGHAETHEVDGAQDRTVDTARSVAGT